MIRLALLLALCANLTPAQESDAPRREPVAPRPSARPLDIVALDGGLLLMTDSEGFAHSSRDGGRTWGRTKVGVPVVRLLDDRNGAVWGLVRGSIASSEPVAALMRSRDQGQTWRRLELDSSCRPICFVPDFRELALLSNDGQLWHWVPREDGEGAWDRLGTPNPDRSGVCAQRMGMDTFLVSSRERIYSSTDLGRTWRILREGGCVELLSVLGGLFCATGSHTEYAVTSSGELLGYTSQLAGDGAGWGAWTASEARVERKIAGITQVTHAEVAWFSGAIVSGMDEQGRPVAIQVQRDRDEPLPTLPGTGPMRVTQRAGGTHALGDALYVLAGLSDRWAFFPEPPPGLRDQPPHWELVWPLK